MSYYHDKVLPKNLFHFPWLLDTQMKGNTEKRHLIMSTDQSINVQLGGSLTERSDCEKMLGVK